jgi:hypothetical protein
MKHVHHDYNDQKLFPVSLSNSNYLGNSTKYNSINEHVGTINSSALHDELGIKECLSQLNEALNRASTFSVTKSGDS